MHDHECGGQNKSRDAWRFERQAKRAAWRARWAARRAGQGDWSHLKDPKFWGLNSDWGMHGHQAGPNYNEVEQLKAQVAEMETTIGSMQERIAVLERLILDLDKEARESRLAAEIEKLRDRPEGGK